LRFIIKGFTTEEVVKGTYSCSTSPESLFSWPGVEILARTESVHGKVSTFDAGTILEKWLLQNNLRFNSFTKLEEMIFKAREVYKDCSMFALKKGVFIAEAKFEFGFDEKGKLFLVDEVLNPDCARFWLKEDFENKKCYEAYDKRILIEWLKKTWWGKRNVPPPKLTEEMIKKTSGRYETILRRIVLN
jgi:phosphoribosylaminoimidazole-succinocarboxamide synthase